ncbi:VOC family protein [Frondihabitans cladoniiphilus]|uniref:VOC family protein n=1 Tax=Frondihabitans cladoniiphilus TaxID=715785 RepID=A0ABP8VTV0_9MICO
MTTQTGPVPRRLSRRPDSELLAQDTGMGAVTLRVADLDTETAFYRDCVLLTVLEEHPGGVDGPARVVLGRVGTPIVILEHTPELRHAAPHEAGLYHVAVVFERQPDLAAAVYSVATRHPGAFTGSSDHFVSQAFYFTDPEGNGVELYWDRDRTQWSWIDGHIKIGGSFLDPNRFLEQHLDEAAIAGAAAAAAKVGHLHLSVGDLAGARDFYVDKLGFEIVMEVPGSALFVSAGGYHHHMAMNIWNSQGAGPRQNTLGLGRVRIDVPAADDLGALGERLHHYGVSPGHDNDALLFADPWGNAVEVATIHNQSSGVPMA